MKCIEECPICGGGIEATKKVHLSGVALDGNGEVTDEGRDQWCDPELTVYCSNDHSHREMIEALKTSKGGVK